MTKIKKYCMQRRKSKSKRRNSLFKFDKNKDESLLGKGFFGNIYSMINLNDKQIYAVKHINIKNIQNSLTLMKARIITKEKALEFIMNESEILAKLNHPNIVRYYNTHYTKKIVYISFELMRGGNLENAIKNKIFYQKPDIIYNIILQICNGLSYLHSNNILHRDIKASNILLLSDNWDSIQVKLADFGLSYLLESGRYHLNTKERGEGDVFYRSPEEIAGNPYGRGNDNWAVGIVILEMLSSIILCENITGNIFSQYVNFDEYVETILEDSCCIDDTPENIEYCNRIKKIVLGLLEKDQKKRMRSDEIVNTNNYNCNFMNDMVGILPNIKNINVKNKPKRRKTLEIGGILPKFDNSKTEQYQTLKKNVSTTHIKPTILPKIINAEINNKINRPFSA